MRNGRERVENAVRRRWSIIEEDERHARLFKHLISVMFPSGSDRITHGAEHGIVCRQNRGFLIRVVLREVSDGSAGCGKLVDCEGDEPALQRG